MGPTRLLRLSPAPVRRTSQFKFRPARHVRLVCALKHGYKQARMKPHLLFVDDEVTMRDVLMNYFSKKGFVVSIAATASEAMFIADQWPIHLVVMDINLAGENGLELLKFFKSNFPKLPV